MASWRVGPGWSDEVIQEELERLERYPVNFRADQARMTPELGWNQYYSEALIAREAPGLPVENGAFHRAEAAVAQYEFSDPDVVVAHFDADSRLLGRRMLLEIKAFRVFHFLAGVVVGAVRCEEDQDRYVFGFRYDTLDGHIERGSEWFLLSKDLKTGEICFRIEAAWLPGQFPNWWSRLGFRFVGPRYQRLWHHEAHSRLFRIAQGDEIPTTPVDSAGIAHAGPTVTFKRNPRLRTVEEPIWQEEETVQSS